MLAQLLSACPASTLPAALPPPPPDQVITGFLGSGKTTLLNNILTGDHGKRIAGERGRGHGGPSGQTTASSML
jgi:hypothetical protein